jgi:hypothetical protein
MKAIDRLGAVLAFAMVAAAFAQQSAPRGPAGSGQSLAAAMQFIQSELNGIGKLHFTIHITDKEEGNSTSQYIEEISNVVADPSTCTVRYRWWRSMHGEVVNDEDVSFSLHNVLGLSMLTPKQYVKHTFEKEKTSADEKQTYFQRFDPPMYMIATRDAQDNEQGFTLADQQKAIRLANAMGHAVELCGGKNLPF